MKIIKIIIFFQFIHSISNLSAHPYMCGIGIQADLVRFQASINDIIAVASGTSQNAGKIVSLNENWNNGYRIALSGLFFSTFFQINYLHLYFQDSQCRVDLLRTKLSDEISSYVYQARKSNFYEAEGIFQYLLYKRKSFQSFLEGGINYSYLNLLEFNNTEIQEDSFDINAELQESYFGIGPQIGWKWRGKIFPWIAIENSFQGSILIGENHFESKVDFGNLTIEQASRVKYGDCDLQDLVRLVPMCQMQLALSFFSQCCLSGMTFGLKGAIGYEVQYFYQILVEQPKYALSNYKNFGWQGFFLSFALFF